MFRLIIFVGGCAAVTVRNMDAVQGPEAAHERMVASNEEINFEHDYPQWGMPFGLPGLTSAELSTVTTWLSAGAKTQGLRPFTLIH